MTWIGLVLLLCAVLAPGSGQPGGTDDPARLREQVRSALLAGASSDALEVATRLAGLTGADAGDRLLLARASLAEAERLAWEGMSAQYVQALLLDAEQSARVALESASLRDEAAAFLAFVLQRRGARGEAMELLDSVLLRTPDHVDALALRGYLRLTSEDPLRSLPDLEHALELAPGRIDVRMQRARALSFRSLEETEEALSELVSLRQGGLGETIHDLLGTVPDRAARVAELLIAAAPDDPDAWFWTGRMRALAGDLRGSLRAFDRALEQLPDDSRILAYRADIRGKANDVEGMLDDLVRVLRSGAPEAAWAERRLLEGAPWLAERGDWSRIVRLSRALVQEAPSEEAYLNLALALRWLGMLEEAEMQYLEGIALYPDSPRLLNDLGLLQEGAGRYEDAAARFQEAGGLESLDGLENLAVLRLKMGDCSAAAVLFRTVLEQDSERLRSIAGYADLLLDGRRSPG
ncbi:MAG: tetratricopeptide repeat protein [Planctomycetota bacterium]